MYLDDTLGEQRLDQVAVLPQQPCTDSERTYTHMRHLHPPSPPFPPTHLNVHCRDHKLVHSKEQTLPDVSIGIPAKDSIATSIPKARPGERRLKPA